MDSTKFRFRVSYGGMVVVEFRQSQMCSYTGNRKNMELKWMLMWLMMTIICFGDEVCVRHFCVAHRGITHTHIEVTVWKMCGDKEFQPATIISTGSLVMAKEYHGIASAIANRHLTVFAADYTTRVPEIGVFKKVNRIVRKQCNRGEGGKRCKCSRNGTHVTVSSFRTMARFASRYADTRNALVFGHSSGATVVMYDLFKQCDQDVENIRGDADAGDGGVLLKRHFCDGAKDTDIRHYRPIVVALFDGIMPIHDLFPLKQTLMFNMLSQFASNKFTGNATQLLDANAVDVWFDENVNHFGPNDFNHQFQHAKTSCAFLNHHNIASAFRTTDVIQTHVVFAIADVMTQAYFKFVAAGNITIPSIAIGVRNTRYVQRVSYKV